MRLLTFALLALMISGCFYSREISQTRHDLERTYPDLELDQQVVFSMGPLGLRTVGWIAGFVPEEEAQMASRYVREIQRVKVGVYEVDRIGDLRDFDPASLRRFERGGWEVAARIHEDDELVWVMYRERHDTVRDLYVVVLDGDELVLARVQGRLNRLMEQVMQDHTVFADHIDFDFGF
ncbi:MAG: hypothetical protein RhofKO_13470 [Rhodothermales bacterium]